MSALPFIVCCPNSGSYSVTDEAVKFLQSLSRPIGVITMAGKYRTGKSLFLNRVLLQRQKAFGIGSTVNACTKGIWLYTEPVKSADGLDVLVMDSEGIGSLDADSTHDSRVFALAILLSSMFVYNSVGSIDDSALRALSLVTNISKQIRISQESEATSSDLAEVFPSFVWVVRDFSLLLENRDGLEIDADTYLETALCSQSLQDDTASVKKVIRECFVDRSCVTMVRPCQEEKQLQNLDNMPNEQLRRVFVDQMVEIRANMLAKIQPKTYMGHKVTGNMLATLAQNYVQAINMGAAPVIKDSWQLMVEVQSRDVMDTSWQLFLNNMNQEKHTGRDPVEYKLVLDQCSEFCLEYFQKHVMETTELEKKLESKMSAWITRAMTENEQVLKTSLAVAVGKVTQKIQGYTNVQDVLVEVRDSRYIEWEADECEYTQTLWDAAMIPVLSTTLSVLMESKQKSLEMVEDQVQKLKLSLNQLQSDFEHVESKLNTCEENEQQLQQDLQSKKNELEHMLSDLTSHKDECEHLSELLKEWEHQKSEDAALHLKLSETQQDLTSLKTKYDSCVESMAEDEKKFQTLVFSLQQQALQTINQLKTKNQDLTSEISQVQMKRQKEKVGHQNAVKDLMQKYATSQKSETNLVHQLTTLQGNYDRLQSTLQDCEVEMKTRQLQHQKQYEKNMQDILKLNATIKDLETKRTCENIDLHSCKKRLAEVQESATQHKKLKVDLHRADTDREKHKSLADWLSKDKTIKESRINELQNQVNELEKRCYDTQKQYEIDLLKMKLVASH